ncbi:MAG: tetratricopeptide repeat protein [Candidatus Coatesbacteria bacterium]|nr:tetratricopeptide repeat protein [Candidatus Coatesbacteria bacterium]
MQQKRKSKENKANIQKKGKTRLDFSNILKESLPIIVLAVIIIIAYFSVWNNGFIYDDHDLIENNPLMQEKIPVKYIFTTEYWETTRGKSNYYRPLIILSYRLENMLWNKKPSGFHVTNLLIHILISILIYFLSMKLGLNKLQSLLASAIFGISPLHTQSVAWISGRTDLLATFFALGSYLCFINARKLKSYLFYILSGVLYLSSILSKEITATLPIVIIAIDFINNGNELMKNKKAWIHYLVFLLPILIYVYLRLMVVGNFLGIKPHAEAWWNPENGNLRRFLTVPQIFVWYLYKNILPINLNFDRGIDLSSGFNDIWFYISSIVLLAWIIVIFVSLKNYKIVSSGLTWLFITLIPLSNIFPIFESALEHLSYFPSIGFAIVFGFLYGKAIYKYNYRIIYVISIIPIIIFMILTQLRLKDWKNDLSIWRDTLAKKPHLYRAQSMYGLALADAGFNAESIEPLKKALAMKPDYAPPHYNLGLAYKKLGKMNEARKELEEAIRINPELLSSYNVLGSIYFMQNEFKKMRELFEKANKVEKLPYHYYSIGIAAQKEGNILLAKESYENALKIDPDYANAYLGLGEINAISGNEDKALYYYSISLKINPYLTPALDNMGLIFLNRGEYSKAKAYWERALQINPQDQIAKRNLSILRQKSLD